MLRICLLLIVALFGQPSLAEPSLRLYTADYSVQLNGLKVGELQRSLKQQGDNRYLLETRAITTGLAAWLKPDTVIERSLWHFAEGQPRPMLYSYHYSGRNKDVEERLDFDWENGVVHSLRDGQTTQVELVPGTLDKQVFEIAMQQAIEQGVSEHIFPVAVRGRLTDYDFTVLGTEQLVTRPFGTIETIKVQRGRTTMWLASEHNYLVVKIRQRDKGSTATSYLLEVQYH